ncbi:MAG: class I SAM-dependent methyltransferase, partial [Desulfobacteraceae bacterium]
MTRKGTHFQQDGQAPSGPGHDFFGHGSEIRAALSSRLPTLPVRALDVGTGFGRNAVFLARQLPAGSHVWSVDPSDDSLARG